MWTRIKLNSGRSPNTVTKSLTAMMPTFIWCSSCQVSAMHCGQMSRNRTSRWLPEKDKPNCTHSQFWGQSSTSRAQVSPGKDSGQPAGAGPTQILPRVMCGSRVPWEPHPKAAQGGSRTITAPIIQDKKSPKELLLLELTTSKWVQLKQVRDYSLGIRCPNLLYTGAFAKAKWQWTAFTQVLSIFTSFPNMILATGQESDNKWI